MIATRESIRVRPIEVDEAQAEVVRQILAHRDANATYAAIADELNRDGTPPPGRGPWTIQKIHGIANNPIYRSGDGHLPPLVMSESTAAPAPATRRTRATTSRQSFYALNGLVWCSCGRKMEVARYNRGIDDERNPRYVKFRCRQGHGSAVPTLRQQEIVPIINAWLLDRH